MSLTDQQWCPTSVQVTVHQAKGLRIKGKSGTNDAYAVMQVGKEKFQTSVVEKSVAPVWKEEAAFDLPQLLQGGGRGADRSTLHVHVLHRALVGPDKLLGQAVINLLQLSEDKSREKTEWFKLLDKTGKPDKERGEVLLDIQFMRNNMTASMFDLSAAGKSRSRLGKIKDKVRGKKKDSDSALSVVPALTQVLTDSEEEESANGVAEGKEGKEKSKKQKMKSLFAPKSNLQKNMSQSMSVLPGKNSSLSGSQSSGLNVDVSEGKKKFKFSLHKRSGSSDGKTSSSGHQKPAPGEQSNLCINGSHVYCEEPQPRTSRATSNFSLLSSGHGSMEEVPDNSPPSGDSLTAVRESPWMEEGEEEEAENSPQSGDSLTAVRESPWMEEEEEAENVKEDVNESRKEEEQRIRIEEEALRRQQEELEKFEKEKLRREEEMRLKVEMEEEEMKREEEMLRQQEELEKLKQEEKEMRRAEEERTKREEEERIKVQREEEERKRIEEEEMLRQQVELERLAEEKLRQEEERRRAEEERAKREEEEKKVQREEEEKRKEEEMLRQESERQAEEKARQEEEEQKRLAEEMRELEEEKRQREEEERIRREEEEEEARQEEEHRLAEERRLKEEENERMEEERRQKEQLVRKREEQKRQMEEEERLNEELRRREEEETARREREEQEKWMEEKRRIEAEEKIRKDEEERARMEEEKLQREQEERRRRREEEETLRRRELEKLAQEKLRQEEEERREAEERAKKEEEERIQKEEERRREEERLREEERARKEREEERRRLEEQEKRKMEEIERIRKEEQEKIREEEKRKREEEEERTRKEKEEVDRMREQEKRKEEEESVRREEMERKEAEEKQKAGKKKLRIIPAENLSTNPFDEDFSPSEPSSSSAPEAPSRSVKTVQRCNSVTSSADEKDLINAQREKRPAPRPPGRSQPERRRPEEEDLPAQPKTNGQSKEKEVRTVSVPPQRSVQVIAPLNRSSRDTKSETQTSNATKRPAPSRPLPVEEPKSSGRASLRGASEAKPVKTVQSLNPFDDDDDELTAQHDVTKSAGADKDDASLAKVKSSKMAHAPAPPAPSGGDSSSPSIRQDDGGPLTGGPGLNAPNQAGDPEPEAKRHEQVQESPNKNTPPAKVQKVMVAGVKEEGPTVNSRRLQTVKPLNPLEQQPAFVQEENDKPTALDCSKVQHNTKVDAVITGPYSQLTRDELISLVLKQEKQLADKDKKISELELYIDDLLVRVIEVQPSILMSMSSLK